MNIKFFWFAFSDLSPRDLYEILWLRQQVFVIEQACLYPDIDQNDPVAAHLIARPSAGWPLQNHFAAGKWGVD